MKKELYVIITAGGLGTRMGSKMAKQFLAINNKPILLKTIEAFKEWREDINIILVLPQKYKEYWKEYCVENDIWIKHTIISGGITRFHSVKNALQLVPDNAIVAVHDGVRPFVPKELIEKLFSYQFNEENNKCCVIPALPATDSMREKVTNTDGQTISTQIVNRENYIYVQTPQVFLSTQLKSCYNRAYSPSFTDDASVMESNGYSIDTIEGSRLNIKITTPEDLTIAEAISTIMQ